jgi:hypothetical protein
MLQRRRWISVGGARRQLVMDRRKLSDPSSPRNPFGSAHRPWSPNRALLRPSLSVYPLPFFAFAVTRTVGIHRHQQSRMRGPRLDHAVPSPRSSSLTCCNHVRPVSQSLLRASFTMLRLACALPMPPLSLFLYPPSHTLSRQHRFSFFYRESAAC